VKRRLLFAVAVAALLAAGLYWRREAPPLRLAETAAVAPPAAVPAANRESVATPRQPQSPTAATAPREDSLRGTAVDGAVNLDAQGRLLRDRELRRLFDYFLARLGERSPAQIRADLLQWLAAQPQLDAALRAEVAQLFDRYVELQRAAAALGRSNDLQSDLQRLRELRRRELGDELAEAWFGEEERYAALTLERLAVARDPALDGVQRAARLAQIDSSLDTQQQAARSDSTGYQLAVAQSELLDAGQANAAQRNAERTQLWGAAAAQRLAELDQQEADWQLRLRAYALARTQLLADTGLAATAREARLQRLLDGFSEEERRRVLALAEEGLLPQ
jgi:lipase chaperone LimK